MNKASIWIAVVLLAAVPLAAQTITVVSPNGGETLTKGGSPFSIAWTVRDVTQDVKIVLLTEDDERFGLIAEGLEPGSSPYNWAVGETRSGEAPAGNYKIRVVSEDGVTKDVSDRTFAIAGGSSPDPTPSPTPVLRLLRPNGGETLPLGGSGELVFDYKNVPAGAISVALYRGGTREMHRLGTIGTYRVSVATASVKRGAMKWRYGENKSGMAPAGSHCYFIQISVADGGASDFSDAPFSLFKPADATAPGIQVNRPSLGEDLTIGFPATIEWVSPSDGGVDIGRTVSLVAVRISDGHEYTIANSLDNRSGSNTYRWSINPLTYREPGDYRVRVVSSSGMTAESSVFQLVAMEEQEDDLYLGAINRGVTVEQLAEIDVYKRKYRVSTILSFRNNSPALYDYAGPDPDITATCFWIVEIRNYDGEWVQTSGTNYCPHYGTLRVGPIRRGELTTQNVTFDFMINEGPIEDGAPHRIRFVLDHDREFNDPDRSNNERVTGNLHFERY